MSHCGSAEDMGHPRPRGAPCAPLAAPPPLTLRVKRRRTRRERDAAKFGGKNLGGAGGRRGAGPPPPRPPLLPWVGGSPLAPPRPVVITQNRLCRHRGLFNREVKSVDVERLLSSPPAQGGTLPPPAETPPGDPRPTEPPATPGHPASPETQAVPGEPGGAAEVSGQLRALLGGILGFGGRDLVNKHRGSILAALRRHHRGLPDLELLLAHRHRPPPGTAAPGPGVGGGGWGSGAFPPTPKTELFVAAQVAGAPGHPPAVGMPRGWVVWGGRSRAGG